MFIFEEIERWPIMQKSLELVYQWSAAKPNGIFNYFELELNEEEESFERLYDLKKTVS